MNQPNEKQPGSVLSRLRRAPAAGEAEVPSHSLDELTGVKARPGLHDAVEQAVLASKRTSAVAVLTFVELGELRDINDTFGPDAGDQLLRSAAERLSSIDVPGTEVVRYEGAAFAIVFPSVPNLSGAEEIARFLVELMGKPFELGQDRITVGVYVGGSVSTDNYDTLDDMVRDAYQSLVKARDHGLGAWVMHDESKRARYSTRIDDRRLHDAIENNEFHLQYQPIINLDSTTMVGIEALLRWTQPGATNVGMLFPHDFLPLLEKTGLIIRVGEWVLDEACRQIASWNHQFPESMLSFVSCNIGARQLADDGFGESVKRALELNNVHPQQLCIDLTEEALRYNRFQRDSAWATLRGLKDIGVRLGIDDFGTGNASLNHLREFRLDMLRLHRDFVGGLGVSREDSVIIKHITAMAHDLDCVAVAEGVETDKQEAHLRELGVDLAQGFRYGRPLPPAQIAERLRPGEAPKPEDPWDPSNVLSN